MPHEDDGTLLQRYVGDGDEAAFAEIWLNSNNFHGFQDGGGRTAVPYLLVFRTSFASPSEHWPAEHLDDMISV